MFITLIDPCYNEKLELAEGVIEEFEDIVGMIPTEGITEQG